MCTLALLDTLPNFLVAKQAGCHQPRYLSEPRRTSRRH